MVHDRAGAPLRQPVSSGAPRSLPIRWRCRLRLAHPPRRSASAETAPRLQLRHVALERLDEEPAIFQHLLDDVENQILAELHDVFDRAQAISG
jgi:hypothetical protein